MPSDRIVTSRDGLKEIEFQPSTIETIDFAMFNYLDKHCNLHTQLRYLLVCYMMLHLRLDLKYSCHS